MLCNLVNNNRLLDALSCRPDVAPAPEAKERKLRGSPSPARSEAPKAGSHAIAGARLRPGHFGAAAMQGTDRRYDSQLQFELQVGSRANSGSVQRRVTRALAGAPWIVRMADSVIGPWRELSQIDLRYMSS